MTFIDSHRWSWVVGAVAGRGHRRVGRGSQDAVCVRRAMGAVVAVVCDGCSAGAGSAVGAGVGARFVAATTVRLLEQPVPPPLDDLPSLVVAALVDELARLAAAWTVDGHGADGAGDRADVIADSLLFTVQVAVLTDAGGIAFGVGDGRLQIDGVDVPIHGASDGAPDCPAYALLPDLAAHATLQVHRRLTAGEVPGLHTLLIGSDGALELDDGVLAMLGTDDALVHNPSLATKRLLAGPGTEDDCTVVVLRRAPVPMTSGVTGEAPCA